ncbi:MAG TPA: insulinase family protein [Allosphingosinicella sp.]|jgi:zinc protease
MTSRAGRTLAFLAVLFAALASPAAAQSPAAVATAVAPDPAVTFGRLANGMHYAIMRNDAPAGAVSVRLAMDVGSYEETDEERGYAHFIEHMVFRSTRQAPDGALDNRFASLGVQLGRDQNAETGLEATVYRIDLPKPDLAGVKTVLEWMRGAADGVLFAPAGVDVERGVVMSELRSRNSPMAAAQREMGRFQMPGMRSPDREPGGTEESLRAATAPRLEAFYRRWYRPDNATLVIVGDAPVEALIRAAEEAFGSWRADGPAPARPQPTRLAERGLSAWTRSDPSLPSSVSACRFGAPDPENMAEMDRVRRDLRSLLWTTILGNRFNHLTAKTGSPLLAAAAQVSRDIPDARGTCLLMLPTGDRWKDALGAGQAELRRFAKDGPTQQEVTQALDQLRSAIGGSLYQSNTRSTPALAEGLASAALNHRTFVHPRESLRLFQMLTQGITPAEVRQAFADDWSGTGPLLAASTPTPLPREALLAAWRANEGAAPLAAYSDLRAATWEYKDFGTPGRVTSREVFHDPDYVRLRFENGTIFNFKQTKLQSGGVEIRVRFGNGEGALDNRTRLPAGIAASFFPLGGLGRMDYEQVGNALMNTTWGFTLELEPTSWLLSTGTLTDQVPQQMRLLAAYATDPAFGRAIDEKMPAALEMVYRSYHTDPSAVANEAIEKALFPNQLSIPPREQVAAFNARAFQRLLKPVLDRSPMEVAMVGDISEDAAVDAVARTFGALSPRPPLAAVTGPGPFRRFPATLPGPRTAYHQGPADKAAAVLMWPLYVASYERRKEEYSLNLLAAIYQTRLIQQIRGTLGKTYSPQVVNPMPDAADQGYLAASIETSAADLDQVIAAARAIAAELAAGRISQEEVDAARSPLVAARVQAQTQNDAWAGILSLTNRFPVAMYELTRYDSDMAAIGLDDVRRAAATWLKRDPVIGRAVPAPLGAARH